MMPVPPDWQARLAAVEAWDAGRREQLRCIAHDLASPLTPMRLQLSMWKEMGADVPGVRLLEHSIDRMERLVEDIADLAWLEGEGLRIDAATTDLRDVVEDVVDSFAVRASSQGIDVSRSLERQLVAFADRVRIGQVLDNLLRNAFKFTSRGGAVAIEAKHLRDVIQISVADTGRGMMDHERSRLFRPYSQLRRTDAQTGTGLGLFLCKNIVGAHRGTLWAESDGHGKGSRFVMEIPAVVSFRPPSSPADSPEPPELLNRAPLDIKKPADSH